jgi:hypothetical protein
MRSALRYGLLAAVLAAVFAAAVLAAQSSIPNTSYSLVPKNVSELARESDLIVVAKVKEILPSRLDTSDPKTPRVRTDVDLGVERVIKGALNGGMVEVRFAGGTADRTTQVVSGEVRLEAGQRVLIFLKKEPETVWGDHFFVHGFTQGRYLLTEDGRALNEDPARNTSEVALIAEIQRALKIP